MQVEESLWKVAGRPPVGELLPPATSPQWKAARAAIHWARWSHWAAGIVRYTTSDAERYGRVQRICKESNR